MKPEIMLMRYLRSQGLQNADIAELLGKKGHQNISYHFRKLRSAFFNKQEQLDSNGGGVVPLLVGYVIDPPPPVKLYIGNSYQDHSCPHYCEMAAYAQLEDLPKHQKIAVLLNLLAEVEKE